MKLSPDFTNIMTECSIGCYAGFPWLKDSIGDFAPRHAQLSDRGRQVLGRLLTVLPSCLKSQPNTCASPLQPALFFSICDALQLDHPHRSTERSDSSVLPSVLGKLREWRLLDQDHRYSPGGVHKLALDLAGITDEAYTSTSPDLNRASPARLRVKWVGSDSQRTSQDQDSSPPTPSSPSPSQFGVLDSAQECAHDLLKECRSDPGYKSDSCQAGTLGAPDSEETSVAISQRHRSVSGFRSGCSACRHLRLSPPASTLPSPQMTSVPFNDIKQFDASPRHPKSFSPNTSPRRIRHEKNKSSPSIFRGERVDENEPPTSKPVAVHQGLGISFPCQRTYSPRISNIPLPREPFSPIGASVQRRLEPSHLLNQVRKSDKHKTSHRFASVDLRSSVANRLAPASPNDLHPLPPMRAQSFSHTLVRSESHGSGSVGAGVPKLSSNAAGSRSSKRLPSWSRTHPTTATTSLKPLGSMTPPAAMASIANPPPHLSGGRSRPLSTSIPHGLPSDVKHRDRRSVSSQTHKHTSSVGTLSLTPTSSPLHARRWQV